MKYHIFHKTSKRPTTYGVYSERLSFIRVFCSRCLCRIYRRHNVQTKFPGEDAAGELISLAVVIFYLQEEERVDE